MTEFDQNNQKVNQQTNVGRDQIIQNIVLVGEFLDFAQVEGLIPKPRIPTDFNSISQAFEKTFAQRLEGDLVHGISFAGEILKSGINEWKPRTQFAALNRTKIINKIPTLIMDKLIEYEYWDAFQENGVIWLESVQLLWINHFKMDKRKYIFGIARYINGDHKLVRAPSSDRRKNEHYIPTFSMEEFRVFLVGIVIDLIRLYSLASDDKIFWEGFVNLLGVKRLEDIRVRGKSAVDAIRKPTRKSDEDLRAA